MNKLFLCLASAVVLCSCNIGELFHDVNHGGQTGTEQPSDRLRDFSFSQVVSTDEDGVEVLKAWKDSVTYSLMETPPDVGPGDIGIDWGGSDVDVSNDGRLFECVEFNLPQTVMRLDVYPEGLQLKGLSVESSDTTVLRIVPGDGYFDFRLEPEDVGDVTVRVSVDDGVDVMRKSYRVQVRATVTAEVFIDAFWKNPSLCKVRYRMSGVPDSVIPVVFAFRDSLAVDADCYWTDVRNGVYEQQREVFSYVFTEETFDRIYSPDRRQVLRNFGEAMDHFETLYRFGSEFIGETDVITDVRYDYYPVHARLYIDVFSNCSYLDYRSVVLVNEDVFSVDVFKDTTEVADMSEALALEHLELFLRKDVTAKEDSLMTRRLVENLDQVMAGGGDPEWIDEILQGYSEEEKEEYLFYVQGFLQ